MMEITICGIPCRVAAVEKLGIQVKIKLVSTAQITAYETLCALRGETVNKAPVYYKINGRGRK
jgi:hypothetical protein